MHGSLHALCVHVAPDHSDNGRPGNALSAASGERSRPPRGR
jgi:hypothetical protein